MTPLTVCNNKKVEKMEDCSSFEKRRKKTEKTRLQYFWKKPVRFLYYAVVLEKTQKLRKDKLHKNYGENF